MARAIKSLGIETTASDVASYSEVFAKTWIELDGSAVDLTELDRALAQLNRLPGKPGYFTENFCLQARYFQPENGARVDSIREHIESEYRDSWMYYPLLAALILAADRVDSTTGVQMAFLKSWSRRSRNPLELRDPDLISGVGHAIRGDVTEIAASLPEADLAYLDPPYNQHRYFGNYHVWETLVRWDKPDTYGIANKRVDTRAAHNKSAFNTRKTMPSALAKLVGDLRCETIMLSYNNESWLTREELLDIASVKGHVEILDFDFKRYVGSQIGVYNKSGEKVGLPAHRNNIEHIVIAGNKQTVRRMITQLDG